MITVGVEIRDDAGLRATCNGGVKGSICTLASDSNFYT